MRSILYVLLFLFLFTAAPTFAASLLIVADKSDSSAVATDEASAKAAARYVRTQVAALKPGEFARFRTLGDRSSAHLGEKVARIERHHPANMVADQFAHMIASLPSNPLEGSKQTNLLVLTDGIEASSLMSEKQILQGKPLPAAPEGRLKGCDVTFWGIGRRKDGALPVQMTMRLRDAWSAYFKTAGAKFTPIDN